MRNNWLIYTIFLFAVLSSCAASLTSLRSSNMNKIELGMSKEQVSDILGKTYTIAEKYMEAKDEIEVISYRNFPHDDEFYLFKFKNDKLERWYRELQPKYDRPSDK